ncbi:hypothetical protein V6N11_036909 [Hibiscus sabdariffa]|uniref:Uncharacterized protein n=1 Tax=Hibiscus sabdariffa TaxID=183260 RepID=A0ABR2RC50_9ROSI
MITYYRLLKLMRYGMQSNEGYGWQIGSGSQVSIWNDPWLLGRGVGRVKTHDVNTHFTWVSDLIDDNSRTWKHDIIDNLFDTEDRDRICCIPLARPELQDKIVWRYDQTGEYSVKSGYEVLRNEFSDAPSSIVVQFYKQMWNVNLPLKVKLLSGGLETIIFRLLQTYK